jgi:hypothetical protein
MSVGFYIMFIGLLTRRYIEQTPPPVCDGQMLSTGYNSHMRIFTAQKWAEANRIPRQHRRGGGGWGTAIVFNFAFLIHFLA